MFQGEVNVYLSPDFRHRLSPPWLRSVVVRTLEQQDLESPIEVGVVITDNETVQGLNHKYRGLDEVTDVLAFPFYENIPVGQSPSNFPDPRPAGFFVTPPGQLPSLGEVIISYPQAKLQARQHQWRVRQEVALLVIHGVLHLLGLDHIKPKDEKVMEQKQQRVLANLFKEPAI